KIVRRIVAIAVGAIAQPATPAPALRRGRGRRSDRRERKAHRGDQRHHDSSHNNLQRLSSESEARKTAVSARPMKKLHRPARHWARFHFMTNAVLRTFHDATVTQGPPALSID